MNGNGSHRDPLELHTIAQASAILKRSPAALHRDIRAGRLQAVRLGRSVRIPRSELERVIAEGKKSVASAPVGEQAVTGSAHEMGVNPCGRR